ncbi:Ryanodine receptor 1, partial [Dissostichus eleginoides]
VGIFLSFIFLFSSIVPSPPCAPPGLSPSAETEAACVPLITIDIPAIDPADYRASCLLIKEIH